MNHKAFTLIELLAVIIILSLLMTITITNMLGIFNESKEKSYNLFITDIQDATQTYVNRHPDTTVNVLNASNPVIYIYLGTLIDEYLVKTPVINPKTNEELDVNTQIEIKLNSDGTLTYTLMI